MTRLLRLALGMIVAFVFAGRVEAATQHCARLAHERAVLSEPAAPPCHMLGMDKPADAKAPAHHGQAMSACECVAFAKTISTPAPMLASSRIAAFVWARPQPEAIASLDRTPEGPPPKG